MAPTKSDIKEFKEKKFQEWLGPEKELFEKLPILDQARVKSAYNLGWWACEQYSEMAKDFENVEYKSVKPPPGAMPKKIWLEKRIVELMRAIHERVEQGLYFSKEWNDELKEHLATLNSMQS